MTGECEENSVWMVDNCQRSCRACPEPIETTTAEPTTEPPTTTAGKSSYLNNSLSTFKIIALLCKIENTENVCQRRGSNMKIYICVSGNSIHAEEYCILASELYIYIEGNFINSKSNMEQYLMKDCDY